MSSSWRRVTRHIWRLVPAGVAGLLVLGVAGWLLHRRGVTMRTVDNLLYHMFFTPSTADTGTLLYRYVEVDPNRAGDVKMVGDIDGDGQPDLVLGGDAELKEDLVWYHNPDWKSHLIAVPQVQFTTDGAMGDVDGDGDLDIVVPDSDSGFLRWYENPRPGASVVSDTLWIAHELTTIGDTGKDVELADFDGDGRLDVATRGGFSKREAMILFQTGPDTWSKQVFQHVELGDEGMASGDVNGDGQTDLVLEGTWVRNPGGVAARDLANWVEYRVGDVNPAFKALVADVNGDHQADLVFSSSENTADVVWFTPKDGHPTGEWARNVVIPNLERGHTLQAADMDRDGDMDLVIGQMHTSAAREVMIDYNLDGTAQHWQKFVLERGGLHDGVVTDINGDGYPDIYGSNWTGNNPVKLWLSQTTTWTYKQVSGSNERTFGLAFGDVDGDAATDIVAGRYWYRHPAEGLTGNWARNTLPEGMHGSLALDIDGDAAADIIAQKDEGDIGLYWLELQVSGEWSSRLIGSVPRASHELGAQGYRVGQIEAGGLPEVAFSSGQGVYYFKAPADPAGGPWQRVHVSANPSDEGFALGDIDRDGDLDIAATTGDSKRVEWYRNPGDGSGDWPVAQVGTFPEAGFPDRTELADLDGDGKLDVIVTEENGEASGAETFWWQQPQTLGAPWERRLVVTQATTNSMDAADIDGDGDMDLVLAEHRGTRKLAAWLNNGHGLFTEQVIDQGKESHLGARTVDLDQDGDLDIVSIAYDDYGKVHLWQNNCRVCAARAPAP